MIRGSIGSHTCGIEFVRDLKADDGESLVGQCVHDSQRGHIRIQIDPESSGIGMLDTIQHEALHAIEYVFRMELEHPQIYAIAAALTQFLISTNLVDPTEFEARVRALMTK